MAARLDRLRSVMTSLDVQAVLTADPINIFYATGMRNMSVFSMMDAARFALINVEGPVIVWEFAGAEHLAKGSVTVDERLELALEAVEEVGGDEVLDDEATVGVERGPHRVPVDRSGRIESLEFRHR